MAWHIVEKFLEQVAEHSTLIGKFWVTFFFVLRFLLVVSIVDNVFEDEQEEFVCNTLTPGCKNVCFNEFSPLSLLRFWALQILGVALPSLIFMIYTAHKLTKVAHAKKLKKNELDKKRKKEEKRRQLEIKRKVTIGESIPAYHEVVGENAGSGKKEDTGNDDDDEKDDKVVVTKLDNDTPSKLMLAYIAQVVLRLLIEIGFTIAQLQIYVFKFWIPELFQCSRWPCPNVVDCFVSRPKEKTAMLWVMFGTSVVMVVLSALELYHLGFSKMVEAWQTRDQDITKEYKLKNNMPSFGGYGVGHYGTRYPRGYPEAVGIRVGYARSSISGGGNDIDGDQFI